MANYQLRKPWFLHSCPLNFIDLRSLGIWKGLTGCVAWLPHDGGSHLVWFCIRRHDPLLPKLWIHWCFLRIYPCTNLVSFWINYMIFNSPLKDNSTQIGGGDVLLWNSNCACQVNFSVWLRPWRNISCARIWAYVLVYMYRYNYVHIHRQLCGFITKAS